MLLAPARTTLPAFDDALSMQTAPLGLGDAQLAPGPTVEAAHLAPRQAEPLAPPAHEDPGTISDIHGLRSFGWWAFGAATAFFAHEGTHIFANLVQGNVPKIQPIWGLGFAPFFAIEPRIHCDPHGHCVKHNGEAFHGGVGGAAAITSGGLNMQHLTDEILLTRRPYLRTRQVAPFRKGMFAFNILLSVGYAITSITGIENQQGDVTSSTRYMGYPKQIYAAEIAVIAALDTYRYFVPNSRWAPWVSRASKVGFFGMVFAF